MTDILSVLRSEHANIARLLRSLERQILIFDREGEPDHDIVEGVIDYFLSYPDLYHHPKEELLLARLRERDPAAAAVVGDLKHEHEELASSAREFAATVRAALEDAEIPSEILAQSTQDFIALQTGHLAREEKIFFPAAQAALTAEDWAQLEARMTDDDDPLFGGNVGERYRALHQDILEWERQHEHE